MINVVLISSAFTVINILADVYSYPEDDSVLDPHLAQHLAHFGIDFSTMQKVSKGEECVLSDTLYCCLSK